MASVELVGVGELLDGLRAAERFLESRAEPFHRRAAGVVFDDSQRLVQVDTGRLKASGRVTADGAGGQLSYGRGLPYAGPAAGGDRARPQGGYIVGSNYLSGVDRAPVVADITDVYEDAADEALRVSGLT